MSIAEVESYQDPSLEVANAIAGRLHAEATVQINKKIIFEDRVIKDLRQYHGRYEADIESRLTVEKKSRLFINQTRAKTHAWEARLSDMLFPTDADNWGIRPTPVPELMGAQELIKADSDDAQKLLELQALAKAKAKAMQAEIRDQFVESSYNIKARGVIHDGVKMGTGIIKGPIVEILGKPGLTTAEPRPVSGVCQKRLITGPHGSGLISSTISQICRLDMLTRLNSITSAI